MESQEGSIRPFDSCRDTRMQVHHPYSLQLRGVSSRDQASGHRGIGVHQVMDRGQVAQGVSIMQEGVIRQEQIMPSVLTIRGSPAVMPNMGFSVMFSQLGCGLPRLEFLKFGNLGPWGLGGLEVWRSLVILKFGDLGLLGLRGALDVTYLS